jgi:hypothetical protein
VRASSGPGPGGVVSGPNVPYPTLLAPIGAYPRGCIGTILAHHYGALLFPASRYLPLHRNA